MGGSHLSMLVHAVVVDAEDGLSAHGAEGAAVYQTGALLHAGEAAAGVVTGPARHPRRSVTWYKGLS